MVELLVVIAVLAILASLMLPALAAGFAQTASAEVDRALDTVSISVGAFANDTSAMSA